MADYSIEFDVIRDELVARVPPMDLDTLIVLAIRIVGLLRERKRERALSVSP